MKKFVLIGIVIIIVLGVYLLFIAKDDPTVAQAKTEIKTAHALLEEYQNTVNAIPALELSADVKNDFKIESNYLGAIGRIVPDGEPQTETMAYINQMLAAATNRGSARFQFDFDMGLENISKNAVKVSEVAGEDLNILEKLSNTFDAQIQQAKIKVPQLTPLTAERNKKTEKYFLEFNRIEQKLNALTASLDNYSSVDFREKIKKLKIVNELFSRIAIFTQALIQGIASGYALEISKIFPELGNAEAAVKKCFQSPATAGCKAIGPFPGGYQIMLQQLEPLYSQSIEN